MNPAELLGGGNGHMSPTQMRVTPNVGGKTLPGASAAAIASGTLTGSAAPRVNVEPIYTQLKAALGDNWNDYKAAISAFVTGQLNQAELAWVLQPYLSPVPSVITSADPSKSPLSTLRLHNAFLASIYENTLRDYPPTDVAPWVVATDKPTATAKNTGPGSGANDKADERLKREVMTLHARDRKRIKGLKEAAKPVNNAYAEILGYSNELAVRPTGSDAEPQSATGTGPTTSSLARSSYDIETRRRWAETLASEALEFPGQGDIQNRIEPICYEEGLTGVSQGALPGCAEIIEQALEVQLKEMLGSLLHHARSNGAGGEGVQTNKFRRQLRKEEDDAERGILQRNAAGLLPAEMEMQAKRQPLDRQDLRLSINLYDPFLRSDRFLDEHIMLNQYPIMDNKPQLNGFGHVDKPITNGVTIADPDAMDIDGTEYAGFQGIGKAEHDGVMGALDDCLLAVAG
ncbi:hypothetical protein CLAFUR0_09301 [Fulvia fulva]|nr:hypothetical protein CLAFUR0_09301 [Fulvia fulva]